VEEVVNSLIDSRNLVQTQGGWQFTGSINEITVPPTIQGVIMADWTVWIIAPKRFYRRLQSLPDFYQEILENITLLRNLSINTCRDSERA
jgi:hypothetical protein